MFEFALKGDRITKATENAVVTTIDNQVYVGDCECGSGEPLSRALREKMVRTILQGIIRAAAYKMFLRGVERQAITEKVSEFVDLVGRNKDLPSWDSAWLKNLDWFQRSDEKKFDRWELRYRSFRSENEGLYAVLDSIWNSVSDAKDCYINDGDGKQDRFAGLTEREKAVLSNYIEARDKYYEAERAKQALLGDVVYDIMKNIVTKYTQAIAGMDVDVYKACCSVSGVTVDETVANTAPSTGAKA